MLRFSRSNFPSRGGRHAYVPNRAASFDFAQDKSWGAYPTNLDLPRLYSEWEYVGMGSGWPDKR